MTITTYSARASHGKDLRVYGIAMGVSRLMMRTYKSAHTDSYAGVDGNHDRSLLHLSV